MEPANVLGSTVLITDSSGMVLQNYEYDPFGSIIGLTGGETNKYLYTGQEFDEETDLYYYNARYYNPLLGRFISRDPMIGRDAELSGVRLGRSDLLSRNGYIYAKNNPLRYVDPSGEMTKEIARKLLEEQEMWKVDVGNSTPMFANGGNSRLTLDNTSRNNILDDTLNSVSDFVDTIDWEQAGRGTVKILGGGALVTGGALSCGAEAVVCVPAGIGATMATAPVGGAGGLVVGGVCINLATAGCVGGLAGGSAMMSSGWNDLKNSYKSTSGNSSGSNQADNLKFGNENKIRKQMKERGWTEKDIREAMQTKGIPAQGKKGPATRYVNQNTGKSVVVDNTTGEIFHVGGEGFKY